MHKTSAMLSSRFFMISPPVFVVKLFAQAVTKLAFTIYMSARDRLGTGILKKLNFPLIDFGRKSLYAIQSEIGKGGGKWKAKDILTGTMRGSAR